MITEAEDAVEAAAFLALNVPAMAALAPVFQHVPSETPPPVQIIGPMTSEPLGVKGADPDAKVSLILVAITDDEQRKPLRAIKAKQVELLDGQRIEVDGWEVSFTFEGSDGDFDAESNVYFANTRFSALALKQ